MQAKAPGVIKLLGEHAVVYGKLSLASAISIYANAKAEKKKGEFAIELKDFSKSYELSEDELKRIYEKYAKKKSFEEFAANENAMLLPYATIASILAKKQSLKGIEISVSSDIPVQKGYASSAACSTAFALALARAMGLEISDNEIVELARNGDKVIHKNEGAGRIDINASYYGGIVSYSSKEGAKREEISTSLNLFVVDTGPKKSTAETVGHVAKLYNERIEETNAILNEIDAIARQGISLLKANKLKEFGELMYRNHELLKMLGVSSEGLDRAVEKAKVYGMLGAKLSGGGGGGIAIVLADEGKESLEFFKEMGFDVRKVSIDYNGAKGLSV
jgi:mevalonate kinase